MKGKIFIAVPIVLCLLGVGQIYVESRNAKIASRLGRRVKVDPSALLNGETPLYGNPDASIKLMTFSDFECKPCRSEWRKLKELSLDARYCVYMRNFPLRKGHSFAERAAIVSRSSDDLSVRRKLHDALFNTGLNEATMSAFERDFSKASLEHGKAKLAEDETLAMSVGVNYTPTLYAIFDGGVYIVKDVEQLK